MNWSANSQPDRIRPNSRRVTTRVVSIFGPSGNLLITTMLFLGMLMLMAGSLTGALMFGTVTWLIWWAWLPSTDDTPHPP